MECPVEEITADWKTSGPLAESARHSARGVGGIAQADGRKREAPEDTKERETPEALYNNSNTWQPRPDFAANCHGVTRRRAAAAIRRLHRVRLALPPSALAAPPRELLFAANIALSQQSWDNDAGVASANTASLAAATAASCSTVCCDGSADH